MAANLSCRRKLRRKLRRPDCLWTVLLLAVLATAVVAKPLVANAEEGGVAAPRCELVPLPNDRVSMQIDGVERTCWHFGKDYPRPFFYPFRGPSGASLTRMGHPGAENHDHHRSIWFAHQDVAGYDFWSDRTDARIRQKHWYAYRDGDDEAVLATRCGWYDAEGKELLDQTLVVALRPMLDGEHALELQITLRPSEKTDAVALGRTNFGLLAVRVAKSISEHFGGGTLSSSEGQQGESAIFGKPARWMDYSGTVRVGRGERRRSVVEGITYFDHPNNLRFPASWHVREDGWMGASFCMTQGHEIKADSPLTLRYLLHAHRGAYDAAKATGVHAEFAKRPGFVVRKSVRKHQQYEVERE